MKSEGKLIYSRRFHAYLKEELERDESLEVELQSPLSTVERFLDSICENSMYIQNSQKQKGKDDYVECAQRISEEYRLDMDITDYSSHIEVEIFTPCRPIWGELKLMLGTLLLMSDSFYLLPDKSNPDGLIIAFHYKIYNQYINGKKVEP